MSIRKHRSLSRRSLLRGMGLGGAMLTLPLPRLDAMLNVHGDALADGKPLPVRYGIWFFGNGINIPTWVPKDTGSGASWQLSECLTPLAPVKKKLTVISGLTCGTGGAHWGGPGDLFSPSGTPNKSFGGPTVDQLIAARIGTGTRFRSLEVMVSNAVGNVGPTMADGIAHSAAFTPIRPEPDPRKLWQRLFGDASIALPVGPSVDPNLALNAKRSVLDSVRADAEALKKRLGASDQAKLDAHLDGIRAIEKSLAVMPMQACGAPPRVDLPTGALDNGDDIRVDIMRAHHELLAVAMACDLTRVFSMMWSRPASELRLRSIGLPHDLHNVYCHNDADNGGIQPNVTKAVKFAMECFVDLLVRLDQKGEGAGSVLDNMVIMASSEVAFGKRHEGTDHPMLLAGRGGGALASDRHIRVANAHVKGLGHSVAKFFGVDTTKFSSWGRERPLAEPLFSGQAPV